MKKRRGRRGFWWWTWLLALVAIGATVGGFFMGKKRWEDAPKEYLATARMSFNVRDPFVPAKTGISISTSRVADKNEAQVLRDAKSEAALSELIQKLELTQRMSATSAEIGVELRSAIELDLNREKNELNINVTLNDPVLAADVANAVAEAMPDRIKRIDERSKNESLKQMEDESQPFVDQEFDALEALKKELAANNINIDPNSGIDLGNFLLIPEVLTAKLDWDSAQEILASTQTGQAEYRSYWAKAVSPSRVQEKAVAPPYFVGPALKPYQTRWTVYGLTAGLVLGLLLMVIFWKLFP